MKVVCNSSVLISLTTLTQLSLLKKKFGEIIVPKAVYIEVVEEGGEREGAREVKSSKWIKVEEVKDAALVKLLSAELDKGESESIALAHEISADLVLLDEKDARQRAERLELRVLGTVGILIWAKKKGYIKSLKGQLDLLQDKAKFRISQLVYEKALESVGEL